MKSEILVGFVCSLSLLVVDYEMNLMIEHEILGLGLILDENEYVSDKVIKRTWTV